MTRSKMEHSSWWFQVAVANALRVQSVLESNAAGSAFRLSRASFLLHGERHEYGGRILHDEYRHAALCDGLATTLGATLTVPKGILNGEADDLERLVALVTAERLFLLNRCSIFTVIGTAGPVVRAALDAITADERHHAAYGIRVLQRLACDPSIRPRLRAARHLTMQRSRRFMVPVHNSVLLARSKMEHDRR